MSDQPSVITALANVMAELPAIGKGDKAPQGYSYRGIEAITKHLQPLLAKHGVVIVPSATLQSVQQSPAMKDGWQDVYLNVAWRIYGPDGSHLEAHTCGIGRDNSDKGVNKAQTQAYKYLLLHLLAVADKADDPDGVDYSHGRYEPPRDAPRSDGPTQPQLTKIMAQLGELGHTTRDAKLAKVSALVGRELGSSKDLTAAETRAVVDALEAECQAGAS